MSLVDYAIYLLAGVEKEAKISGDFYHVLESTSNVYISLDEGPWMQRSKGLGEKRSFKRMRLKSLATQGVIITAGYGELIDTRDNVSVTVSATVTPSDVITPQSDVILIHGTGAQVICAANANRKSLVLKGSVLNDPAIIIRIGNSGVLATKGIELTSGEGVTLDTQAAVYGINTHATEDFTVTIIENSITP